MFCGKSSRLHAIAKERGDTFRLYDGGPERHEISDEAAFLRFDPNRPMDVERLKRGTTLGKVLDHPALFAAYPELKSLPIKAEKSPDTRINAAFSPLHGIYVNEKLLTKGETDDKLKVLMMAVLHETQHAIQTLEGDENGASPKAVESLVMREIMRPQLDTVARMLSADPDIRASEVDFPAMRAFVMLVSNPRTALRDPEVMDRMRALGFDETELRELGQACEALFKLRGIVRASEGFDGARNDIESRITAAYQALPGELEAHLTPRRLLEPRQAFIPQVLITPHSCSLKDRLIVAFAKATFCVRMRLSRIKHDLRLGVEPHATPTDEVSMRRPQIVAVGGPGDERPLDFKHRLGHLDNDMPGQRYASEEILSAIREVRSMTAQDRAELMMRAKGIRAEVDLPPGEARRSQAIEDPPMRRSASRNDMSI